MSRNNILIIFPFYLPLLTRTSAAEANLPLKLTKMKHVEEEHFTKTSALVADLQESSTDEEDMDDTGRSGLSSIVWLLAFVDLAGTFVVCPFFLLRPDNIVSADIYVRICDGNLFICLVVTPARRGRGRTILLR